MNLRRTLSWLATVMMLGIAAEAQQFDDTTSTSKPSSNDVVDQGETGDEPISALDGAYDTTESDSSTRLMWKLGTTAVVVVIVCVVLVPNLVGAARRGSITVRLNEERFSRNFRRTHEFPSAGFWLACALNLFYLMMALLVLCWTWFVSE